MSTVQKNFGYVFIFFRIFKTFQMLSSHCFPPPKVIKVTKPPNLATVTAIFWTDNRKWDLLGLELDAD